MSNGNRLFIISDLPPEWLKLAEDPIPLFSVTTGLAESSKGYMQLLKGPFGTFGEIFWVRMPDPYPTTRRKAAVELPRIDFKDFLNISRELADMLEKVAGSEDTIWIREYHLFPLVGLMRSRFPEITIGLSVDITFPSLEEFGKIPAKRQDELVSTMLNADVLGFTMTDDSARFLQCVQTMIAMDADESLIRYQDRLIKIGTFPINREEGDVKNADEIPGIQGFFAELRIIKRKQENYRVRFFDVYSRNALLDRYRNTKKRLFLLDYDGTLTPSFNLPSLTRPDNLLMDILNSIAQNRKNSVYIISGRDSGTLDKWLGHLPVNIIAEHGIRWRYKGKEWEEQGIPVQLPAPAAFGPKGMGKGEAIRKVLSREEQDFILAIGDDRTDEDMFTMLSGMENAWTIKVGKEASFAQYNLHTPQMVISLLGNMSFLEQQSYK